MILKWESTLTEYKDNISYLLVGYRLCCCNRDPGYNSLNKIAYFLHSNSPEMGRQPGKTDELTFRGSWFFHLMALTSFTAAVLRLFSLRIVLHF